MHTMRREINLFVAWKSFKYNDVIDSKIVNLNIWYHFRLLNELSREFESNSDLKSILSQVRRLILSNQVKSEDWYQVIELSQNVNMKTWFNDQSMLEFYTSKIKHCYVMSSFKERQCTRSVLTMQVMRISVSQWVYLYNTSVKCS